MTEDTEHEEGMGSLIYGGACAIIGSLIMFAINGDSAGQLALDALMGVVLFGIVLGIFEFIRRG